MSKTISQLPIASTVASADVFPLDQGGLTKQATLSVIADGLPSATGTGGLVRQLNPSFNTGARVGAYIGGLADSSAWSLSAGSSAPGVATSGAWISLYGGTSGANPGLLAFGCNTGNTGVITNAGNFGIGTLAPAARLHVASGDFLIENNRRIAMPDASGSQPYFITQIDNNWVFYGTNSTGGVRPILNTIVRSDTESLNVNIPLRIGADGSPIQNVITTVFNHTPAAIPANGGVIGYDVTVTGSTGGGVTIVDAPGGLSNPSIILKANHISPNTIRVFWINPTTASVTLPNTNYRIVVINF
jgi:hypothetical protein